MEIALFDTDSCEQYQLDDLLSAIMFSKDEFNITFYSSCTLFACDLAQKKRFFDIFFVNVATEDNAGFRAAEYARRYGGSVEIVLIATDYRYLRLGYRVKALDYLLKPYNKLQLSETMDRFYDYIYKDACFSYKSGSGFEKVKIDSILYLMSIGRKVAVTQIGGRVSEFYGKLETSCQPLIDRGFVRVHQSYLVNMSFVRSMMKDRLIMENGEEIPVSRGRFDDIKAAFLRYYDSKAY